MTSLKIILISFLLLTLFLFGCKHSDELSRSIIKFEESNQDKGARSFYFYPSTIRMFNTDQDSSFNALVKDIKKLKITTFTNEKDTITPDQIKDLITKIHKESFVDLLQMKQGNQQFMVFLQKENNKPREFLGIVYSENNLFIVDLLGSIPVSSLPSLITGNIKMTGFNSLFTNITSQKQSKQKHGKRPSNQ